MPAASVEILAIELQIMGMLKLKHLLVVNLFQFLKINYFKDKIKS